MSVKTKGKRFNRPKPKIGNKTILENLDNSLIVEMFKDIATILENKQNKYERIYKCGRDITIESKRIIFQLHTIDNESKREQILNECNQRLNKLAQVQFKIIAFELENEDQYQFYRAYGHSLQEYVEALTYYQYCMGENIDHWNVLKTKFTYTVCDDTILELYANLNKDGTDVNDILKAPMISSNGEVIENIDSYINRRDISALLPPSEFILGLGDLSGELMRKCINSLTTGDVDTCFQIRKFVQKLYTCFLSLYNVTTKELNRKCYVMKQNLNKIELVCCNFVVRGSELAPSKLDKIGNIIEDEYYVEDSDLIY